MSMPCMSTRYTRLPGITEYRVRVPSTGYLKPLGIVPGIVPGLSDITWYIVFARHGAWRRCDSVVSFVLDTVPGITRYACLDPMVY